MCDACRKIYIDETDGGYEMILKVANPTLSQKCHFREASFGDERSEEKSPHPFQKEISHFVRNDNPELFGHPRNIIHEKNSFITEAKKIVNLN